MEQFMMTIFDAVNYLKSCCKDNRGLIPNTFGSFYCGVTNDIKRREAEHKATFLGYVTAQTLKGALDLEVKMNSEGF